MRLHAQRHLLGRGAGGRIVDRYAGIGREVGHIGHGRLHPELRAAEHGGRGRYGERYLLGHGVVVAQVDEAARHQRYGRVLLLQAQHQHHVLVRGRKGNVNREALGIFRGTGDGDRGRVVRVALYAADIQEQLGVEQVAHQHLDGEALALARLGSVGRREQLELRLALARVIGSQRNRGRGSVAVAVGGRDLDHDRIERRGRDRVAGLVGEHLGRSAVDRGGDLGNAVQVEGTDLDHGRLAQGDARTAGRRDDGHFRRSVIPLNDQEFVGRGLAIETVTHQKAHRH